MPEPLKAFRASGYRLLRNPNERGAVMTVPAALLEHIPEDTFFDAELTDEGLLYRPRVGEPNPPPNLPAWTKGVSDA